MKAYSLLEQLRSGSTDQAVRDQFNSMKKDLGYGLLLKRYTPNVADATEAQIQQATKDSIPRVAPLYFAFRIMVACGFLLLAIIALSFWSVIRNRIGEKKWLLRAALYGIPLPWIAVEAGWFVAEYGRQPWAIGEVLPTAVASCHDRRRSHLLNGADLRPVYPVPGGRIVLNVQVCTPG